jgi:hypothetical protein
VYALIRGVVSGSTCGAHVVYAEPVTAEHVAYDKFGRTVCPPLHDEKCCVTCEVPAESTESMKLKL